MVVRGEGLVDPGQQDGTDNQQRVVYVLHPNCAIEEM